MASRGPDRLVYSTLPRICMQKLSERWKEAQKQQRAKKPSWVSLKAAVGLCYGLLIYCYYVYVGRVCAPMIQQADDARGSKTEGIVLLVFFNILWLLLLYTYTLVCITPPGFAKDYVEKGPCPEPPFPMQQVPPPQPVKPSFQIIRKHEVLLRPDTSSSSDATAVAPEAATHPNQDTAQTAGTQDITEWHQQEIANEDSRKAAFGPGIAQGIKSVISVAGLRNSSETTAVGRSITEEDTHSPQEPASRPSMAPSGRSYLYFPDPAQGTIPDGPPVKAEQAGAASGKASLRREVPLSAPLHPYLRYCNKDQLVKPPRTHHCRLCGTCVLNMDHHCPWIGQCCGAHNHIYFVTFCFWACISLGYVFVTLLVSLIPPNVVVRPPLDPQITVICAISAVLSFFTGSMSVTHWSLIMLNQSTIESMAISDMRHYEQTRINKEYGLLHIKEKRKAVKSFDQEWGKLNTEGNLWWLGSKKTNWTAVMGTSVLAWFLPPPKYRPDDGLHYQPNPRRGPDGKWIRRSEWPAELQ